MGSISGEFLPSGRRLSCSGHQCWFAVEPMAAWVWLSTGHLASGALCSAVGVVGLAASSVMVVPFLTHAADGSGLLPRGRPAALWQAGQVPQ